MSINFSEIALGPLQEIGKDDWENSVYKQISESSERLSVRTSRYKYTVNEEGKNLMQ